MTSPQKYLPCPFEPKPSSTPLLTATDLCPTWSFGESGIRCEVIVRDEALPVSQGLRPARGLGVAVLRSLLSFHVRRVAVPCSGISGQTSQKHQCTGAAWTRLVSPKIKAYFVSVGPVLVTVSSGGVETWEASETRTRRRRISAP